jgi:hypothetical protein
VIATAFFDFRHVILTAAAHYARRRVGTMSTRRRGETMTTFDKREEGFERKFAHDEETRFKAHARRNRLIGLWAARKLGLDGAAADAYAAEVVTADLDRPDSDAVVRKLRMDFEAKGVEQSDHQINRIMEELMAKALADIKAGH